MLTATALTRLPVLVILMAPLTVMACRSGSRANADPATEASTAEEAGEHADAQRAMSAVAQDAERSESAGEHEEGGAAGEHAGERERGEHAEGEESGLYIGKDVTWDATRRGARLVLSFDAAKDAFVGTVENTASQTLCAVRVEVHLAGGSELGPTARRDLGPGESMTIELPTGGETFTSWTAHPEQSACGS